MNEASDPVMKRWSGKKGKRRWKRIVKFIENELEKAKKEQERFEALPPEEQLEILMEEGMRRRAEIKRNSNRFKQPGPVRIY